MHRMFLCQHIHCQHKKVITILKIENRHDPFKLLNAKIWLKTAEVAFGQKNAYQLESIEEEDEKGDFFMVNMI